MLLITRNGPKCKRIGIAKLKGANFNKQDASSSQSDES